MRIRTLPASASIWGRPPRQGESPGGPLHGRRYRQCGRAAADRLIIESWNPHRFQLFFFPPAHIPLPVPDGSISYRHARKAPSRPRPGSLLKDCLRPDLPAGLFRLAGARRRARLCMQEVLQVRKSGKKAGREIRTWFPPRQPERCGAQAQRRGSMRR